MKINYHKNPLYTTIELSEHEKKELWYKIKIEELEELLTEASVYLMEGNLFNIDKARKKLDVDYLFNENEESKEKSKIDKRCDMLLDFYIKELQLYHLGDCTSMPTSCGKCSAESILGIDTLAGLKKKSIYHINNAFGKDNHRTIDEAIEYLKNYNPIPTDPNSEKWKRLGGYEQYVDGWKEGARLAHDWLVEYKAKYFS